MPSLKQIAAKSGEVQVTFKGLEFNIEYYADRISKEFRAEAMRLQREINKNQRRAQVLEQQINSVTAEDGSPEQRAEDERAESAIKRLNQDEDDLKRQLDRCTAIIVRKWDLTDDDGVPIPIALPTSTATNPKPSPELFDVPAMFEGAVLSEILNDGVGTGEAGGATSPTTTSSSLRQREPQAISRQPLSISRTSRRVRR